MHRNELVKCILRKGKRRRNEAAATVRNVRTEFFVLLLDFDLVLCSLPRSICALACRFLILSLTFVLDVGPAANKLKKIENVRKSVSINVGL